MSKDYYKILGVGKNASPDEIKKAFRKLAAQHHPDKGGDEAKFKEINEAYQTLQDAKKRAAYDQFGSEGPAGFGGGAGFQGGFGGFGGINFEDLMRQAQQGGGVHMDFGDIDLGDIFGAFGFGGGRVRKGRNIQVEVKLTFKESIQGVKKTIEIPDLKDGAQKGAKKIDIEIPAGVDNGEQLQMQGVGEQITDGRPGSLFIVVHVERHKTFRKEGVHVVMDLQVKLSDALLGRTVEIETLDGKEKLEIPAGLQVGQELRIKGKGVKLGLMRSGDLIVRTHIEVPKKLSRDAKDMIEKLKKEGY
jgi:DnaJ-class molecular chaperone